MLRRCAHRERGRIVGEYIESIKKANVTVRTDTVTVNYLDGVRLPSDAQTSPLREIIRIDEVTYLTVTLCVVLL